MFSVRRLNIVPTFLLLLLHVTLSPFLIPEQRVIMVE